MLMSSPSVGSSRAPDRMSQLLYVTAMSLFCLLPVFSMRAHTSSTSALRDPSKRVAMIAFVLLLILQMRKHDTLGVVMVCLNLGLRLCEMGTCERRRRMSAAVMPVPPRKRRIRGVREAPVKI